MYLYNIVRPGFIKEGDPGNILFKCEKCGNLVIFEYEECEIDSNENVKLKNGVELVCKKCGNKTEESIIKRLPKIPQPTSQYVPKCPICHSPKIHKITTAKKVSRVAIFGIFSLPKIAKEWKCDNCGSEF